MQTASWIVRRSLRVAGVVAVVFGASVVPASSARAAGVVCDRVVAAGGSDAASGSAQAPFASVNRLAEALSSGQTGCVRGTVSGEAWVYRDGIRLTSEPGQRGRLLGVLEIWGDGIVVEGLDVHGPESLRRPTPSIYGDDVTFRDNDVTNGDICLALGTDGHHGDILVERVLVQGNRIHDCGQLPRTNNDHGIYVEHTLDARIVDNVIVDNADRGIQLYPNAQRSVIEGNVIDGNGVGIIFSGVSGHASSGNVVRGNVIGNAQARNAVESWYPDGGPVGRDNLVERNCVYGDKQISAAAGGFTARENRSVTDPGFVDAARRDLRLTDTSPCRDLLAAAPAPAAADAAAAPAAKRKRKRRARSAKRRTLTAAPAAPAGRRLVQRRLRGARTGRPTLELSLRRSAPRPVRARVEVRRRGAWRTLSTVTLTGRRPVRVRSPRLPGRGADVRVLVVGTPFRRPAA